MKLTKTKRQHAIGFNMTPMIDIVFLLIIFFMTVSQITRVVDHPMTLPTVSKGAEKSKTTTVTINLDRQGKVIVSGEPFSMNRTIQNLRRQIAKSNNDPSRIKIELRCDRLCSSEHVNTFVQRLSDLGFTKIYPAVAGE